MRRAALVVLLTISLTSSALATQTLEAAVYSATGISRTISSSLQALAATRAVQIVTDFSHDGWPGNTYEVIAWNQGYPDPAGEAVNQWMGSPDHRAILTNPSLNVIGCGSTTVSGRFYAVCELIQSPGQSPTGPVSPPPRPAATQPARSPGVLPNTAY